MYSIELPYWVDYNQYEQYIFLGKKIIWVQLFKANEVVSNLHRVIRKYAEMFCWKNVSSFCSAKASHIFQQKISEYCILNLLKQLTKWPLTSLLS